MNEVQNVKKHKLIACYFFAALVSVSEEVRSRCHLKHRVPQTISESTSSDSISGDLAAHTPHIPHLPVSPCAGAVSPVGTFTSPAPFPSGGSSGGGMSPKATPNMPVFVSPGRFLKF